MHRAAVQIGSCPCRSPSNRFNKLLRPLLVTRTMPQIKQASTAGTDGVSVQAREPTWMLTLQMPLFTPLVNSSCNPEAAAAAPQQHMETNSSRLEYSARLTMWEVSFPA